MRARSRPSGKCDENDAPLGSGERATFPRNLRVTFQNPPFIFPLGKCETRETSEIMLTTSKDREPSLRMKTTHSRAQRGRARARTTQSTEPRMKHGLNTDERQGPMKSLRKIRVSSVFHPWLQKSFVGDGDFDGG